jgi:hypothetical protein
MGNFACVTLNCEVVFVLKSQAPKKIYVELEVQLHASVNVGARSR